MKEARMLYTLLAVLTSLTIIATAAGASDKQAEGKQLISRALDLWDIRADRAPGFRMRATFQVLDSTSKDGSYSELWTSNGQWRREIEISGFRHLEVAKGKKKWLLDSGGALPHGMGRVTDALNPHIVADELKITDIKDREIAGKVAHCVKSETEFFTQLYCINPTDNTLLLQESLSRFEGGHSIYLYRDYEAFGTKTFPRTIEYKADGEAGVELRVVEIVPETSPDISQFAAPPGAFELANCLLNEMTAPKPISTPDPDFPGGAETNSTLVVLSTIVGSDGRPRNIQIVRSGGGAFDKVASRTVERWRFKPASCLGEPVATQINVKVEFRR